MILLGEKPEIKDRHYVVLKGNSLHPRDEVVVAELELLRKEYEKNL